MDYSVARRVIGWYRRSKRDLPWRRTSDPYRIWIAEVMLQQTRVTAVIPYYERFLERFPDIASLVAAPERDLLNAWSGLGYYSRARNLQKAARLILERGAFPADYDSLRALPGVGDYTAAAVASIAFGLPYAVVDGNVRRVLSRFTAGNGELHSLAGELLDRHRPGEFNQALMELGAIICLPRSPKCRDCPLAGGCAAFRQGAPERYPARPPRKRPIRVPLTLLVVRSRGRILLHRRREDVKKLAGFWELPEASKLDGACLIQQICRFSHTIMNDNYVVNVWEASIEERPSCFQWVGWKELPRLPLSTATRKALRLGNYKL